MTDRSPLHSSFAAAGSPSPSTVPSPDGPVTFAVKPLVRMQET